MSNEYPREEELKKIEEWETLPITELLEFIRQFWKYEDRFQLTGKRVLKLYLSTGGWSGNESIITALRRNFLFWSMCWQKSMRGGHYWFRIDLKLFVKENRDAVNRTKEGNT